TADAVEDDVDPLRRRAPHLLDPAGRAVVDDDVGTERAGVLTLAGVTREPDDTRTGGDEQLREQAADTARRRGDDLRRHQPVEREPVRAHHPADAAREQQPADADRGGVARGDRQTVRCERLRDRAPGGAATDDDTVAADETDAVE